MSPLTRPEFLTADGTLINYENVSESDVDEESVEAALLAERRFCGHYGWSVLQHSVAVATLYKSDNVGRVDPVMVKLCKFHDGAEAYLKDVPAGLKMLLPGYVRLYDEFQAKVYRALCGREPTPEEERLIKQLDLRALAVEVFWSVPADLWRHFPAMTDNQYLLKDIRTLHEFFDRGNWHWLHS